MGTGASVQLPVDLPQQLDADACKAVCGDRWDEAVFAKLAKNGKVQKHQLLAAARRQDKQQQPTKQPRAKPSYGAAVKGLAPKKASKKGSSSPTTSGSKSLPAVGASAAAADTASSAAAATTNAPDDRPPNDDAAAAAVVAVAEEDPEAAAAAQFAAEPPADDGGATTGRCCVLYSHYRKEFDVRNGVLRWADVDEEYAISFVFRGTFGRTLWRQDGGGGDGGDAAAAAEEDARHPQPAPPGACPTFFVGVVPGATYALAVTEDAAAGVGIEGVATHRGPLQLGNGDADAGAPRSGNMQARLAVDPRRWQRLRECACGGVCVCARARESAERAWCCVQRAVSSRRATPSQSEHRVHTHHDSRATTTTWSMCLSSRPAAPLSQTSLLTDELKKMSSAQLAAAGDEYQRIKEARDVEDILFSGAS